MARLRVREGKKGKTYQVIYTDSRTGRERCKSFALRKQAMDFKGTVNSGTLIHDRDTVTVAAAIDRWLEVCEKTGRNGREPVEASTLRAYKTESKFIRKELGALRLNKLTPQRCHEFAETLVTTFTRPYARRFIVSLKAILNQAITDGRLVANPAKGVSIRQSSRAAKADEKKIPAIADVRAILAAADARAAETNQTIAKAWGRYRPFLYTLVFSGLRSGEALGLPWKNVDFRAGTITVTQAAHEDLTIGLPKSAAAWRTIPMPDDVMTILKIWKLKCPVSDFDLVFPNGDGKVESLRNVTNRGWYVALEQAGLFDLVRDEETGEDVTRPRYTLNSLRHVRASMEIAAGASPKEIQKLMGHSSIKVTFDVYGHLFPDHQDQRAARANRVAGMLLKNSGQIPGNK